MNPRKDLFLILGATLFLLVGAAIGLGYIPMLTKPFVPEEDQKALVIPELTAPPRGIDYPATPKVLEKEAVKDWLSPEENEDSWDYDLFTTIDIVWDPVQKEYFPSRKRVIPLPPFGVKLVKVGHPTYPYKLSSTLPPASKKEEDRLFFVENVETKQYFEKLKLKQPLEPKSPITLLSFRVDKNAKDKDGFPVTRNVLKLEDKSLTGSDKTIEIDDLGVVEFKTRTDILLASTSEADKTWVFHAAGDRFHYQGAQFVIKGIDLASKTVTVDKTFAPEPKKPKKTFTEVLSIQVETKPVAPEKTPSKK
jgi:hypothetical protein